MAKKTVGNEEQLFITFAENRIAENRHKKLAKKAADEIKKQSLLDLNNNTVSCGGYKITYSEVTSESFTDDVFEFMAKHPEFESCVKTKTYVDVEELHNLMYNGKLSKKLILGLDKYMQVKTTPKLNVEEVK